MATYSYSNTELIFSFSSVSATQPMPPKSAVMTEMIMMMIIIIISLNRPRGFQQVEAPIFQDNQHMKVVRLSALRTGRFTPRKYSWYSFLLEAESTIVRPEGLCQ